MAKAKKKECDKPYQGLDCTGGEKDLCRLAIERDRGGEWGGGRGGTECLRLEGGFLEGRQ